MQISAQISLYPLGREHLNDEIRRFVAIMEASGLNCTTGSMATIVTGESDVLFAALREAFGEVSARGGCVMVSTISNACPIP